jgi:plastocyanin
MKLTKLILTMSVIALLGAGCAGSPAANTNTNANVNAPAVGTVREKPASGSFTVTFASDGEFDPVTAFVTAGTKVTFKNTTNKTHSIIPSYDPKTQLADLASKTDLAPGESFTYTFGKVGRWLYQDGKNPAFGGAVEVSK